MRTTEFITELDFVKSQNQQARDDEAERKRREWEADAPRRAAEEEKRKKEQEYADKKARSFGTIVDEIKHIPGAQEFIARVIKNNFRWDDITIKFMNFSDTDDKEKTLVIGPDTEGRCQRMRDVLNAHIPNWEPFKGKKAPFVFVASLPPELWPQAQDVPTR